MKRSEEWPWSVPVAVTDVPETGQRFDLAADPAVRAAIAKLAGLRALPRFEAGFDVTRHGREGLHVVGGISADIGQICVVTLEPMEGVVEEAVDLVFSPAALPDTSEERDMNRGTEKAAVRRAEGPEPLIDGRIDLGVLATEFLILGIDPYPRKPGARYEAPSAGSDAAHPFAALAALKNGSKDDGR
ncbi:MAG: YceD family protein [Xanthobacteraceae bacterium]